MVPGREDLPETERLGDADIATVAALLGDQARARILLALVTNEELSASALAAEACLSAQATSAHLHKLLANDLVAVAPAGRYRYYRLANANVAAALEALARLAFPHPVRSLRQSNRARALRFARICYDHLAGRFSVAVADALIKQHAIATVPDHAGEVRWVLGPRACPVFSGLGVSAELVIASRDGVPVSPCLDWSAHRPHLAGALGQHLLQVMLERRWLVRIPGQRAVRLTANGSSALCDALGVDLPTTRCHEA